MPHHQFAANPFLNKIGTDQTQIGLWCSLVHTDVVELLAAAAPDWLLFDMEHTPAEISDVQNAARVCDFFPPALAVRVPSVDPVIVKRVLDVGATTLFFPQVQSGEEAALAVSSTRFPPDGVRGVSGSSRALKFGNAKITAQNALTAPAVVVQIETIRAMENLEDICATPGVDAIFIGPADLAASLGHLGNMGHPEVLEAISNIVDVARSHKQPVGTLATSTDFAEWAIHRKFNFVAVAQDTRLLVDHSAEKLNHFRTKIGS